MAGGPDDPDKLLVHMSYVLCELGEHNDETEHATHLWTAETHQERRELWFLWTEGNGSGLRIYHRFANLKMCPATRRDADQGTTQWCGFPEGHHPDAHSFLVTDPLRDVLLEQARREAQRLISESDTDDANES
ncbi:hypothetical protein [Streptomyces griseus]|uniref:hypothetical protein n=1 Tax=Streptomyces griseus TaxID=1911 RepID=UPI0037B9D02F